MVSPSQSAVEMKAFPYALSGADGMFEGRSELFLHACHPFWPFKWRFRTNDLASSNGR